MQKTTSTNIALRDLMRAIFSGKLHSTGQQVLNSRASLEGLLANANQTDVYLINLISA